MLIKKISNDLIDVCINYLHDEENSNKIKENLIDPFIVYIIDKFYPYFIISLSLVLLILVLLVSIVFLIIRSFN
jgi:hypothetical protein